MVKRLRKSPIGFPSPVDLGAAMYTALRHRAREAYTEYQEAKAAHMPAELSEEELAEQDLVRDLMNRESVRRHKNEMEGLPITYHSGYGVDKATVQAMPFTTLLGTNMQVSRLSMGLGAGSGSYGHTSRKEAIEAVQKAYELGVNYFDTSPMFGYDRDGEKILAEALKGIPRESYYVSTKVGRYLVEVDDHVLGGKRWRTEHDYESPRATKSILRSMETMNVDYIDLVYIQDPHFAPSFGIVKTGTSNALEVAKHEGYVRFGGMSGYDMKVMSTMAKLGVSRKHHHGERYICEVAQVNSRYNMVDTSLTSTTAIPFRFIEHCTNRGIGIVNAAPLAMGLLTPQGPPVWHSAGEGVRKACRDVVERCQSEGVDVTRIAMHYAFGSEWVGSHLVGLRNVDQVTNAVSTMTSKITETEAACLNWGLMRLDELDVRWWQEKDAIITGEGYLTEDATLKQHYDDKGLQRSGRIFFPGTLQNTYHDKPTGGIGETV